MCSSGYTHQEISNIFSVSDQSGISKFLKRRADQAKTNFEAETPEKTYVKGDLKILRCLKQNRQLTLADITDNINERLPSPISSDF